MKGSDSMQFLITAYDGKNKLNKRMEVRPRHIENMARINGEVICAGGLLDEKDICTKLWNNTNV